MGRFCYVALFARAWIEMLTVCTSTVKHAVALFARAWIEISLSADLFGVKLSRPLREGVD